MVCARGGTSEGQVRRRSNPIAATPPTTRVTNQFMLLEVECNSR